MHAGYVVLWNARSRLQVHPTNGAAHNATQFNQYLEWLHRSSRLRLRLPYSQQDIAEADSDEDADIVDPYDAVTREAELAERGPLEGYVVRFRFLCQLFHFLVN